MKNNKKIKVKFCGWQERLNKPAVLLVNILATKSTVVYDDFKHIIVNKKK